MMHKSGLVIGKFYPLHKGHELLISAAIAACEKVFVVLTCRPPEKIPGVVRVEWIRELFPSVEVILLPESTPYHPDECASAAEFYAIWRRMVMDRIEFMPEAMFSSEDYGDECARFWGCKHICVDKARAIVPCSGVRVRADPGEMWAYLSPCVRSYFVKTICVCGPESCGKSSLCEQLARHYGTIWQVEWARPYLGERHCEYEDMRVIAEGHFGARRLTKRAAPKEFIFIDTDTLTTKIYSQKYYNRYPPEIDQIIAHPENQNDFYLLLAPDVPWVPDTSRDLREPEVRREMYERFKRELELHKKRYAMIDGCDFGVRFEKAVAAVDGFLQQNRRQPL